MQRKLIQCELTAMTRVNQVIEYIKKRGVQALFYGVESVTGIG